MGTHNFDEKQADRPVDRRITADRDETVDEQDACTKAPEWAEHQRLTDDDMPCDDGRSGRLDDRR